MDTGGWAPARAACRLQGTCTLQAAMPYLDTHVNKVTDVDADAMGTHGQVLRRQVHQRTDLVADVHLRPLLSVPYWVDVPLRVHVEGAGTARSGAGD